MSDIISDDEQKIVDNCRDKLMEHFDSVRIFVTKHSGNQENTASFETGGGNFYAQLGQVKEWISIQDQYQRNYAIKKDKS